MDSDRKPVILLHVCCAPCAPHVIQTLRERYSPVAYFYNPNIQPEREYEVRVKEVERITGTMGCEVVRDTYDPERWNDLVHGLEDESEGGRRCTLCFAMRLKAAARYCVRQELPLFTTTLTISPHKDASLINRIGRETAYGHGIRFLEADFKKNDGFRKSVCFSRQFALYRQNYCGCSYSNRKQERIEESV